MAIVTGDRYLESLVKFVDKHAEPLIEGTLVLKLNPVGLRYVQSRLEALSEIESLLAGAPVDYLRAYISDLGDHRALQQLQRILRLLTSLKVESLLPPPAREPTPLSLLPFGRLKVLELRGCDLSTSAARGLLELRHTLEKIICHNSTDALRHVFASRVAEIKDSPQWKRLSFVSCACNCLVLMDESLQLLAAVETLDLSRNKFAKVDNLRKCTKLKHLDLGFNHLRTIASLSEVSSQLVKLVLRNNALTSLHGIENLKSLEGLDVSCNIISNFSELEILANLPSLQSLWLEGNPFCCARWYRPQVFSYFPRPDKVLLDEKKICAREFWKRKIIIASRHKRPASYGFYSPAKADTGLEGSINTRRKKLSRLACIDNEELSSYIFSDQETVSCDNEIQSKEEIVVSDEEAEIVDLINKIELMKKERSSLWLQEFQEWMSQDSEDITHSGKYRFSLLNPDRENYSKNKTIHLGESSRYVSDSVQASGDESSTNMLESDNSYADTSASWNARRYLHRTSEAGPNFATRYNGGDSLPVIGRVDQNQERLKSYGDENYRSVKVRNSNLSNFTVASDDRIETREAITELTATNGTVESQLSLAASPGSPPHYKDDILHRRHDLEEEFLQLSAKSFSVASSDSDTSYSDDDSTESGPVIPQAVWSVTEEFPQKFMDVQSSVPFEDKDPEKRHESSQIIRKGTLAENTHCTSEIVHLDSSNRSSDFPVVGAYNSETVHNVMQEDDLMEKKKCRRKLKRRVIPLLENNMNDNTEPSKESNCDLDIQKDVEDGEQGEHAVNHGSSGFQKSIDEKQRSQGAVVTSLVNDCGRVLSTAKSSSKGMDEYAVGYTN